MTTIFFFFFFVESSTRKCDIIDAGKQVMLSITDATQKEKTMDQKHLADFYKKLGGKSSDKPESPVPTPDATANLSEKVYHTVQNWCGNDILFKWEVLTCANGKTSLST